jgi:hypothetical protein
MTEGGTSMVSVTTSTGRAEDSAVTHAAWVVSRDVADMMIEKMTAILGPPRVESIGTVGGAVDSYERSAREGSAVYFDPGR